MTHRVGVRELQTQEDQEIQASIAGLAKPEKAQRQTIYFPFAWSN